MSKLINAHGRPPQGRWRLSLILTRHRSRPHPHHQVRPPRERASSGPHPRDRPNRCGNATCFPFMDSTAAPLYWIQLPPWQAMHNRSSSAPGVSVHHAPLDAPSGLRRPVCSRVTKRVPDFKNCGYGRNVTLLQRNAIDYWS